MGRGVMRVRFHGSGLLRKEMILKFQFYSFPMAHKGINSVENS
jgi:hypothetical protein